MSFPRSSGDFGTNMEGVVVDQAVKDPHLKCAEDFMTHLGDHEIDEATKLLSPTVTYRVVGSHALAGTFFGPEEVSGHLGRLLEFTRGTLDVLKWEDWLVGESHVATVVDINMRAQGRVFIGKHIFLLQFDTKGLVTGITVFFENEASARRFFGP